jgi:hypothetical protein
MLNELEENIVRKFIVAVLENGSQLTLQLWLFLELLSQS